MKRRIVFCPRQGPGQTNLGLVTPVLNLPLTFNVQTANTRNVFPVRGRSTRVIRNRSTWRY